MRTGLPRLLILLPALGAAGCGDAVICDSSPLVVIQAPTQAIAVDGDPDAPGVQTAVRVRSSLLPGDELELIVLDDAGAQVATHRGLAGAGTTLFPDVTMPSPRASLRVIGRGTCGVAEDVVELEVIAGSGCELQITPSPRAAAAYPVGVLNAGLDPDPAPGFQAAIEVATRGGWIVELYGSAGGGAEQALGEGLADPTGVVRFPQTLVDGPVSFRAVCRGAGGEAVPSRAASAFVDTTPPACDFTSPPPGTSITPAHDLDGDPGNGVQLALEARVGAGGDAAGEPVLVTVTSAGVPPTTTPMTPVGADGLSTATVTLAPPAPPAPSATFQLALGARDRAGNPCTMARDYEVFYEGCAIEILAPSAPVTQDADGLPANGSQVDVELAIGEACVGQLVTSTCGSSSPGGQVPPGGLLTLRADVCSSSPCEAQVPCTFRVSSPQGVETKAEAVIEFDDRGPAVSVELVQPPAACGAQITPAADVDPGHAGVQVVARVSAAGAVDHTLELTTTGGTETLSAAADVTITLAPGLNLLTGLASDPLGNPGRSPTCTIALASAVTDAPPAADARGAVIPATRTARRCGVSSARIGSCRDARHRFRVPRARSSSSR